MVKSNENKRRQGHCLVVTVKITWLGSGQQKVDLNLDKNLQKQELLVGKKARWNM